MNRRMRKRKPKKINNSIKKEYLDYDEFLEINEKTLDYLFSCDNDAKFSYDTFTSKVFMNKDRYETSEDLKYFKD